MASLHMSACGAEIGVRCHRARALQRIRGPVWSKCFVSLFQCFDLPFHERGEGLSILYVHVGM